MEKETKAAAETEVPRGVGRIPPRLDGAQPRHSGLKPGSFAYIIETVGRV